MRNAEGLRRVAPPLNAFKPYTIMSYSVRLQNNFMDMVQYNAGVQANDLRSLPAGYQTLPKPHPFIADSVLYVPIVLGQGNGGGLIGFIYGKVANSYSDTGMRHDLHTPDDMKKAGIKLSSQVLKVLKSLPAGSGLASSDVIYSHNKGFSCRGEDFVKAVAMGYMEFEDSRTSATALSYSDYNLQYAINDKKVSNEKAFSTLLQHFTATAKNKYYAQNAAHRLPACFKRSSLELDDTMVVKWRRPNKNSKWPWTLDHHWFVVQESPIAIQNQIMTDLMRNGGSMESRNSLNYNLPTFSSIRTMENCRKTLEEYFSNWTNIYVHGGHSSHYAARINDIDWPGHKYNGRRLTPETFPIKAALALGVRPEFDQGGQFSKFVPIAGNLLNNTEVVYRDVPDPLSCMKRLSSKGITELSVLMLYSEGLISLDNLEASIGSVRNNREALINDSSKIKIPLSTKVMLCVDRDSAYKAIFYMYTKHGVELPNVKTFDGTLENSDTEERISPGW